MILKMDPHKSDPEREIAFEIAYLLSLSTRERFEMMNRKSEIIKKTLYRHENRKITSIIKRQ